MIATKQKRGAWRLFPVNFVWEIASQLSAISHELDRWAVGALLIPGRGSIPPLSWPAYYLETLRTEHQRPLLQAKGEVGAHKCASQPKLEAVLRCTCLVSEKQRQIKRGGSLWVCVHLHWPSSGSTAALHPPKPTQSCFLAPSGEKKWTTLTFSPSGSPYIPSSLFCS